MELYAPFLNTDLYNLSLGLLDNSDGAQNEPYLREIRDKMDLNFIPPGSRRTVMFNVLDVTLFTEALSIWYADAANADFLIISTEFIEDETGTKIYLITYA